VQDGLTISFPKTRLVNANRNAVLSSQLGDGAGAAGTDPAPAAASASPVCEGKAFALRFLVAWSDQPGTEV